MIASSNTIEKKVTSVKQAQYELIDVANPKIEDSSDDFGQEILETDTFG
jgi:hypothetical protein